MKRLKRIFGVLLFLAIIGLWGCSREEATVETVQESEIESFALIRKPERIIPEIELPASYYIEESHLPTLRNQNGTNLCWALASLSALECSKDYETVESYSPDHLRFQNPFSKEFEEGGSYVVTMAYLLSWMGPVWETEDPFDGQSVDDLDACVHVQEIRQSEPKDYEAIKRFVYLYGGVETALYMDFDEYMTESSCYDREHHSYCYLGTEVSNHDVVIVGWDDKYPAENFRNNVQSDGAFLCQNSWGAHFGNEGLFYVSYEDVNIGGYGIVYSRVEETDNYDRIYQSDLCGFTAQIGYQKEDCWFSNVYTAEEDLELRAAGFYATGKHTEYEIYVVEDFTDKSSFQSKKYIGNGFLEDAGYYTIDFPKSVFIEAGKDFAIVVKIQTEHAEYPVAVECQVEGLSEHADLSDGRSYLSYQGISWEHAVSGQTYNICLKAYADLQK